MASCTSNHTQKLLLAALRPPWLLLSCEDSGAPLSASLLPHNAGRLSSVPFSPWELVLLLVPEGKGKPKSKNSNSRGERHHLNSLWTRVLPSALCCVLQGGGGQRTGSLWPTRCCAPQRSTWRRSRAGGAACTEVSTIRQRHVCLPQGRNTSSASHQCNWALLRLYKPAVA